jgi:hypothetical protein
MWAIEPRWWPVSEADVGNPVFANRMEISSKSMDGKSICQFPDVCFTPPQTPGTPPGVPIPYPNTGMASDTTDGSSSVKIGGEQVMLKDKSAFSRSTGDEAGSAPKKGIINNKIKGKVFFVSWSMDVKIEGENVVRNLDMTTHNHGSSANGAAPMTHVAASTAETKHGRLRKSATAIQSPILALRFWAKRSARAQGRPPWELSSQGSSKAA